MKLKIPLLTLQLFLIFCSLPSCLAASEFTTILTELNRTIVRLDNAAVTMLINLTEIPVKYPKVSKELKTKVVADFLSAVGRARSTSRCVRDLLPPLSAATQKGFQVPEDLLPAMIGLTLDKLVSTIRACGNSLETQWEEWLQSLSNTTKNSAPETKAQLDTLITTVSSAIQTAIQPLKLLLVEVGVTTVEEIVEDAGKTHEILHSKYSYNQPFIQTAIKLAIREGSEEELAEIVKVEEHAYEDPNTGVDTERLNLEMKEHLDQARLLRVPQICMETRKSFELKQRLFEDYEDAVTAQVDTIRLKALNIWVQLRKDHLNAQLQVVEAMAQQKHGSTGMVQTVMKMYQDTAAATQRFYAANAKLRNGPSHNAHKIQIAIQAAEATSATAIRHALADALMAENDTAISSSYEEISLQMGWLAGYVEQMVELIGNSEKEVTGGQEDPHKLVLGFRKQTEAVNQVVKVASAVHDATQQLQTSLEGFPAQQYLVNEVIKGALQKLLVAVLEAIQDVQDKETIGGEIYAGLYGKVERIVDAVVTALIQFTFDASNGLGQELSEEISGTLDELVNAVHTPSKLEISREDL